jgi:hypothetical protein
MGGWEGGWVTHRTLPQAMSGPDRPHRLQAGTYKQTAARLTRGGSQVFKIRGKALVQPQLAPVVLQRAGAGKGCMLFDKQPTLYLRCTAANCQLPAVATPGQC